MKNHAFFLQQFLAIEFQTITNKVDAQEVLSLQLL